MTMTTPMKTTVAGRGGTGGRRNYGTVYPRRRKKSFRRFYGQENGTAGVKGFNAAQGNLENLKEVLDRDRIPYRIETVDGAPKVFVPVSGNRFHEAVMDSLCVRQMKEDGIPRSDGSGLPVPVYSFFTFDNKDKLKRLQKHYGTVEYRAFRVDEWKFNEAGIPLSSDAADESDS